MKYSKLCSVLLLSFLLLMLSACGTTKVDGNADVTLTYIYMDKNISVTLTPSESEKVAEILDGNLYDPAFGGMPSCGFSKDISLRVGDRTYAIACDTCNYVQDLGNLRFFSLSQKDMEYIRSLFEAHGGHFPCN